FPPTPKMERMTAIARADDQNKEFQISYRHFPGTDDSPEEPKESAVKQPTRESDLPRNTPVHITFAFLFLYIAATRYLIYFGTAQNLHPSNSAQAIGASLGYLFVWSLAYWFCVTSPKKTLVVWLGGAAVFLSTLIGSFVGFILLFAIYFIRRNQKRVINQP